MFLVIEGDNGVTVHDMESKGIKIPMLSRIGATIDLTTGELTQEQSDIAVVLDILHCGESLYATVLADQAHVDMYLAEMGVEK